MKSLSTRCAVPSVQEVGEGGPPPNDLKIDTRDLNGPFPGVRVNPPKVQITPVHDVRLVSRGSVP